MHPKPFLCRGCGLLLTGALVVLSLWGCQTPSRPAKDDASAKSATTSDTPAITRVEALPERVTIPLKNHGEHLFVRAAVDGQDAGMFLLDTGAAIDAVGLGLAGRLKLPKEGQGIVVGIGGAEPFTYRRVRRFTTGDLELPAGRLAGINLDRFGRRMGVSVNGVVGFRSLEKVPFTIDYPNKSLHVHHPEAFEPPNDAARSQLLVRNGLPLIEAEFGEGRRVWLIVDTGADAELTLPAHYADRWPQILAVPVSGAGQAQGVGGHAGHLSTWIRQVQVLGVDLRDVPVNFENHPPSVDGRRPMVGRIGHRLLENFVLTFAAEDRTLYSEFHPKLQAAGDAAPLPFQSVLVTEPSQDSMLTSVR